MASVDRSVLPGAAPGPVSVGRATASGNKDTSQVVLADSSLKTILKKISRQAIFYAALLGIWALLAKLRVWPPYLFPPPWGVGDALWAGFKDHSFLIGIAVTMKRMLIGYSLSVALGMVLGLGVSSSKFLEETVGG